MNELIKINYDSERPTVLGRDLHEALEVDSNYTTWFKRMCEYGFSEVIDFIPILEKVQGADLHKTTNLQFQWQRKYVCYSEMKRVKCSDSILYRLKKAGIVLK